MPQDVLQCTVDSEQKEVAQGQQFAANPSGTPGTPPRRKKRKLSVQAQSKRGGVLDPFTSQLVAWVVGGCADAEWRALVARKCDAGAPPWLDGDRLGLDDLSHRILLLAVAHLVHTQGAIELSPFEGREDLDGECLIKHLALPAPAGVFAVAKRLGVDSPLRTRGYLHVESEWSTRRGRGNEVSVSVAKFLRTDLSLTISALGPLLGLTNAEDARKDLELDGLVLPNTVRDTLNRLLRQPPPLNKPFWIFLKGPAQSGRRTLAQALTKQLGQTLRHTGMCDGPQPGNCILVDVFSTTDEDDWSNVKDHPGWIFLRSREPGLKLNLEARADLVLDLGALEPESRLGFWEDRLHDLGGQFALIDPAEMTAVDAPTGKAIEALQKVAQSAKWSDTTAAEIESRMKELLAVSTGAIQEQQYATKVIPKRTLDELCLEPEAMTRFHRILKSIRGRTEMLERWNLDPGLVGRAKGVLLFHGPSGTGKSMAAEVLAHELRLPLLRVETAELESSPYVGETENRIHKFFASTKGKPSVLVLEEADSFLMERSNAEGSTRRYQINLVNTILRELDQFEGLLCFTSNHADGLDAALERRIMYRLEFLTPTKDVRKRLWESLFQKAPIPGHEELDLSTVAQMFDFTGGRTRLAFLDSLQRAAEVGRIDQRILLEACEEERGSALPRKKSKQIRGFADLGTSPKP